MKIHGEKETGRQTDKQRQAEKETLKHRHGKKER